MKQDNPDIIDEMRDEVVGMAKQGAEHPSTVPVLKGAAIGAVVGAVLPVVTLPIGLVAGAGFALYKRVKK